MLYFIAYLTFSRFASEGRMIRTVQFGLKSSWYVAPACLGQSELKYFTRA